MKKEKEKEPRPKPRQNIFSLKTVKKRKHYPRKFILVKIFKIGLM